MSERTAEGAALDLGRLEDFFVRYGEAVSAGDLKAISGCYAVPSIVLSDAGSIPIATREEIEAAFDGAAERYRAQGMVAARPTVVAVENLTEKLAFADVRVGLPRREEGRSTEQNIYRYVLRLEDAGPRICRAHRDLPRRVTTGRSRHGSGFQGRGLAVIAFKRSSRPKSRGRCG